MEVYQGSETLQTYQRGLKSPGSPGEPGMVPRGSRDASRELAHRCDLRMPKGWLNKLTAT